MVVWWQATPRQTGPIPAVSVPASGQVRLLVVGDTGTGNENQMAVAAAMEQLCRQGPPPDGVLMLGDNFYQAGVSGDDDHQWQDKFLKPYGSPCLAGLTFWAVAGNHDYKGNVQAQLDNKTDGPYLSMPGRMYHLTFGGILRVVAMDSNVIDICGISAACTVDFLRTSLPGPGAQIWSVVMGHHPPSSAGLKYRDPWAYPGSTLRAMILRSLICGKADAWLAGHSHHLEFRRSPDCTTDLLVSGGGGADLYEVDEEDPASLFARSRHGVLELVARPDSLVWTFYDTDLNPLFTERITGPAR